MNLKSLNFFKVILLIILFNIINYSQAQVTVTLQRPPLNQLRLTDLWNVTLNNTTQTTYQVYLKGNVDEQTDGNIVSSQSQAFSLPPGVKQCTPNNISSQSTTWGGNNTYKNAILQTGQSPAGTYDICIRVFDAATNTEIGSDCIDGHSVNPLTPPSLEFPGNSEITSPNPQFVWTPPTPVPSGQTLTYKIKIVQIIGNQTPEAAILQNAVFTQANINITTLTYPISATTLQDGKSYAWQITAFLNNVESGASEVCYFSVLGNEIITNQNNNHITSDPIQTYNTDCNNQNQVVTISNTNHSPDPYAVNQFIHVGTFTMKILSLTDANGSSLTGTGSIVVPWLYTPVAVEFNGIKVNSEHRMYEGHVVTISEDNYITNLNEMYPLKWSNYRHAGNVVSNVTGVGNWTTTKIENIDKWIKRQLSSLPQIPGVSEKIIDQSNRTSEVIRNRINNYVDPPLKFPLGLEKNGVTIAITEMKFGTEADANNRSLLNCVAVYDVDQGLVNKKLGLLGEDIVFSVNSANKTQGTLGLVEDITLTDAPNLPTDNSWDMVFKKKQGSDGCYVKWDCNGFDKLRLDMYVALPRKYVVPVDDNNTDKVKVKDLKVEIENWNDWIVQGTLEECKINASKGFVIKQTTVYYDHSNDGNPGDPDIPNSPTFNFSLPTNYPTPGEFGDGLKEFKDIYIKDCQIVPPDLFKKFNTCSNASTTFWARNIIINKSGLSCDIEANDVINYPCGNISGLGASIDKIKLSIIKTESVTGFVEGKIILPISKTPTSGNENALNYKAVLNSTSGFQFSLISPNDIKAEFFADAFLSIKNTSVLTINFNNSNDNFNIKLNGDLEYKGLDISAIPLSKYIKTKVKFQNVGITYNAGSSSNPMSLNVGTWSFASDQKSFAGFPITIKDIKINNKNKQGNELIRKALSFRIEVNLSENIGGNSGIAVIGAIERNTDGRFVPKYKDIEIDDIDIKVSTAAVKLEGKIKFYRDHQMYGNGFDGTIKATFNSIKMEVTSTLKMGATKYGLTNTSENPYRYWYVDAKVILPKTMGIPFAQGVAFYGFGVGAWKRMDVSDIPKPRAEDVQNATGNGTNTPNSGATFTPNNNLGPGFKVMAVFGTYPEPMAFNSDASLSATFSPNGMGLNKIDFVLHYYCVAELTQRNKALAWGTAGAEYVFPDKRFTLNATVNINVPNPVPNLPSPIIGTLPNEPVLLNLNINGKTNKWYFLLGTAKNPNRVNILGVEAWEYLMFGNDIGNFLTNNFQPKTITGLQSVSINLSPPGTQVPGQSSTGKGFAFGVGVNFDINKSISLTERTNLEFGANGGFEVNLSMLKYPSNSSCNGINPIGFSNWYCQGNVAAWFKGFVQARSHEPSIWCWRGGCIKTFAELKTAGILQAGFPNPVWVTGSFTAEIEILNYFKAYVNMDLSYGTPCTPQPLATNQTYTQEDATQEIDKNNFIIDFDPPDGINRINPNKNIRARFGFTPDEAFDISERQSNGSIKTRTFKVVYTADLKRTGASPESEDGSTTAPTQGQSQGIGNNKYNTNPQNIPIRRSTNVDSYGRYVYSKQSGRLEDWSRFNFKITAVLWEFNNNTNTWNEVIKNGSKVSQTRSVNFRTSVYTDPRIDNVVVMNADIERFGSPNSSSPTFGTGISISPGIHVFNSTPTNVSVNQSVTFVSGNITFPFTVSTIQLPPVIHYNQRLTQQNQNVMAAMNFLFNSNPGGIRR